MNTLLYQLEGSIATLTINRPKQLNALNFELLACLEKHLEKIDIGTVRCLVLTGSGERAFAAGADIEEMQSMTPDQAQEYAKLGHRVFTKLENLPIPVIGAINGYALGGGCELALCCDFCVAAEQARFGFPEASLGILTGFGGSQRLPRLIGSAKAKQLLYTAGQITAQQALEYGLVNMVVAQDSLLQQVQVLAEKIAANAPIAVQAAKRSVTEGMQLSLASGLELETQLFAKCFSSQDQKQAMAAFVQKTKPQPFING